VGQSLVEAGRHDRDRAGANLLDLAASDLCLLIDADGKEQFIGRFAPDEAVVHLATVSGHGDRLETAHQTRALKTVASSGSRGGCDAFGYTGGNTYIW
jgi:hypothetical protein